jgi:hypothetical protein
MYLAWAYERRAAASQLPSAPRPSRAPTRFPLPPPPRAPPWRFLRRPRAHPRQRRRHRPKCRRPSAPSAVSHRPRWGSVAAWDSATTTTNSSFAGINASVSSTSSSPTIRRTARPTPKRRPPCTRLSWRSSPRRKCRRDPHRGDAARVALRDRGHPHQGHHSEPSLCQRPALGGPRRHRLLPHLRRHGGCATHQAGVRVGQPPCDGRQWRQGALHSSGARHSDGRRTRGVPHHLLQHRPRRFRLGARR